MKPPSIKIPLSLTLFFFLPLLFALFFRGMSGILVESSSYIEERFLGGVALSVIVWILYGLICLVCVGISRSSGQRAATSDGVRPLKLNCPKCGRRLWGATTKMLGETGVCPKCKAEFPISEERAPRPERQSRPRFRVVIVDCFQGHDEYGYDTHAEYDTLDEAIRVARELTEEGIRECGSKEAWDGMGMAGLVYDSQGLLVWDGVSEYRGESS